MTSSFYKISCIDEKKECNIIDPISENIDFGGINPISGQRFVKDDIESIIKRHDRMCLNKDGKKGQCCDPSESRFKITNELKDKYKGKKFKINREYGKIKSWKIKVNYIRSQTVERKPSDILECPICLVKNSQIITNCNHSYCVKCIKKVCEDENKCPTCRTVITDMYPFKILKS